MPPLNDPPLVSRNLADLATSGVVVEVDPDEADRLGLPDEDAITEDEAFEANREIGS